MNGIVHSKTEATSLSRGFVHPWVTNKKGGLLFSFNENEAGILYVFRQNGRIAFKNKIECNAFGQSFAHRFTSGIYIAIFKNRDGSMKKIK
jgi:hypothetical protein